MSKSQRLTLKDLKAAELSPEQKHKLERENHELRQQLNAALEKNLQDHEIVGLLEQAKTMRKAAPPKWVMPPRDAKKHMVMPMLNLSDAHFDEVVNLQQTQGRNEYNRAIAERRLKRCFENTCKVARNYVQGFTYPGIVVTVLGDMFSGNIHDELKQTNADVLMGSVLHWIDPMVAGLKLLADEFGQVWANGWMVGNHGRMTHKPIMKNRVHDNVDWLFANLVKRQIEASGDKRITFSIAEAHKHPFQVFNTKFIASHGDEARGGSGIAGMLSPQLIAASKMRKNFDFDIWMLGHWHYQAAYRGIRTNGSLKGFDEFALTCNFDYQVPQQDFFLLDARRGVMSNWPIFVDEAPACSQSGVVFKA